MEASQLRSIFLDYFAGNGHTVVPSASLIPHDPTLLFTNAGNPGDPQVQAILKQLGHETLAA